MRRYLQVGGRGLVLEDAARQVEGGAVAGTKKPPCHWSPTLGLEVPAGTAVGEQPRWVQMPTVTNTSGRMERCGLRAYSGCWSLREAGSASAASCWGRAASISGVRRMIHTGLPRHSTVFTPPGCRSLMSTSTPAPMARARSLGARLDTRGTATPAAATQPVAAVSSTSCRRSAEGSPSVSGRGLLGVAGWRAMGCFQREVGLAVAPSGG